MKVIYREDMIDHIDKAITEAEGRGKHILAITLTINEWKAFAKNLEDRGRASAWEVDGMLEGRPGSCWLHRGVVINLEKDS